MVNEMKVLVSLVSHTLVDIGIRCDRFIIKIFGLLVLAEIGSAASICTGSFTECNQQGLSAMKAYQTQRDIKQTLENCAKLLNQEECLPEVFNSEYFWAK